MGLLDRIVKAASTKLPTVTAEKNCTTCSWYRERTSECTRDDSWIGDSEHSICLFWSKK